MKKRLSFHELAEQELNNAAAFYDSRQHGLGPLFIRQVQEAILLINANPESAQIVKGNARSKPLRRFPHNIIYFVTPNTIRILAIANQRRGPFYWDSRV
ncbi:MAG: hypothetical protein QOD75_346 [Blastocatellia bacterium]|jgi:hypothetical protein|nr:hypothetical protein [Blastocatellia bacterium]